MIIMQTVKCVLTPSFSFFISFPPKNSAMQKARRKAGFLLCPAKIREARHSARKRLLSERG